MVFLRGDVGGMFSFDFPADVKIVQQLLNKHTHATEMWLVEDGVCGEKTHGAIRAFQRKVLAMRLPDGVVSNHGPTLAKLQTSSIRTMLSGPPVPAAPTMPNATLTDDDYKRAAATLGCEVAAIKAVANVETAGNPFDSQGRPLILYERHIFSKLTRHIYDETHPDISSRKHYEHGTYGNLATQYSRLEVAYKLDTDAALMATSWGAFQILGENYRDAGFKTVQEFVVAMRKSIAAQLSAFVSYVGNNARTLSAIQRKDWATFARAYNGPNYKSNHYDTNLAAAYDKFK